MGISLSTDAQPPGDQPPQNANPPSPEEKPATNEPSNPPPVSKFATYKKRAGTNDLGKEFEYTMCALYALKFLKNDNILDFQMTTNNEKYGDFDDISLEVTFTDGSTRIFLIQLKHKENKKNLTNRDLSSQRGDFSLLKYLTSFNNLPCDIDNIVCVLYTNCPTKIKKGSSNSENLKFDVQEHDSSVGVEILTNPDNNENIFQFLVCPEDSEFVKLADFCRKFYFFAGQDNIGTVKSSIRLILQELLHQDIFDTFLSFMRNWWCGRFVLTRHDVVAKLVELALTPWTKVLSCQKHNSKSQYLAKAVMTFDLTIVNNDDDIVSNIWTDETPETFEVASKKYDSRDKNAILWHLAKVPLIVTINSQNEEKVTSALRLLQKSFLDKKIVLVGEIADFQDGINYFKTLADLRGTEIYEDIVKSFKLSLQGRPPIPLQQLIQVDPEMDTIFQLKQLLRMSQEDLVVGSKSEKELPESYISRKMSILLLNTRDAVEFCKTLTNCVLIINCDETFRSSDYLYKVKVKDLEEFSSEKLQQGLKNLVLLSTNMCTVPQFQEVAQTSKNAYLIQIFSDKFSTLLLSQGLALPLLETETSAPKKHISCKKMSIKEKDIFKYFGYHLNVFCAPPGMGKSTLFQILSNAYCPSDFWSFHVNLINLKRGFEIWQLLTEADDFDSRVATVLAKNQKCHVFLDGLDELDSEVVDQVLNFAKHQPHVWISSRENLQAKIKKSLSRMSIEITEVAEEEQLFYMYDRLINTYEESEIDSIIDVVSTSSDVASSQQLLGIPLQLYIITEMFRNSKETYQNLHQQKIFVLTNMYKVFFEGKKKFHYQKIGIDQYEQQLGFNFEHHLKQYEILGLKSCLDDADFRKFQISSYQNGNFETQIEKIGDRFGIVKRIKDDGQPVFDHQTYAEYFACVWLRSHLDQAHLLKERLFSQRYQNLKLMFDMMLAENNPLHLAIIYKNMSQFETHLCERDRRDEGGRSALHLACSYGKTYPEQFSRRVRLYRESKKYMKFLEALVQDGAPILEEDQIFNYNCLDYSIQARCIYPLEKFLAAQDLREKLMEKRFFKNFDSDSLGFYCSQLGYPHLLRVVLTRSPISISSLKFGRFGLLGVAVVGCAYEEYDPPREGNLAVIKTLIRSRASLKIVMIPDVSDQGNILDYAAREGCYDVLNLFIVDHGLRCVEGNTILHRIAKCGTIDDTVVQILTDFAIDINAQNHNQQTALQIAAKQSNDDNVHRLLQLGADVNLMDIEKNTALHYSVQTRATNTEIIKLLKHFGACPDAQNINGDTPLQIACQYGQEDNVLQLLVSGSSDIVNQENNSALHTVIRLWSDGSYIVEVLLNHGFNINVQNQKGTTPLHLACRKGQVKNLGTLLKRGADVNIVDNDDNTALHYACKMWANNTELIYALVFLGVDVNAQNNKGQTALHVACQVCNIENVEELIEDGADITIVDDKGKNALYYVRKSRWYQKPEVMTLLINHGLEIVLV